MAASPVGAVLALGVTQIVGYGSLYYSFSVLAPVVGASFGWSYDWMFAALSVALLAGGLLAPAIGRLIDRVGAPLVMTFGSIASGASLAAAALAPNGWAFGVALLAMEVSSAAALYAAAFAALVQLGPTTASRSITYLTLIAGFASTLFWPLTTWLVSFLSWRDVYFVFAAMNLLICAPLHWWLTKVAPAAAAVPGVAGPASSHSGVLALALRRPATLVLLFGFAIEGFILAAILMHMINLLGALGLASAAVLITSLFGPAQVLSRVVNMLLGKGLRQTHLGIIAAVLPPLGVLVLVATAPSIVGGIAFSLLFGLGSGLTSIVAGSLPLKLFGSDRYGSRLGGLSSARQVASAVAPFLLALLMSASNIDVALWVVVCLGAVSATAFAAVALMPHRHHLETLPQPSP